MMKSNLKVICNSDIKGILWPNTIFNEDQKLTVDRVLYVCPTKNLQDGNINGLSYYCQIKDENVNLIFEYETNTWYMSNTTTYVN
jgi:hypothetical protein